MAERFFPGSGRVEGGDSFWPVFPPPKGFFPMISTRRFFVLLSVVAIASGCECGKPPAAPNQNPLVTLLAPTQNATFRAGEAIALSATASDPEDGPLDGASVVWTSSAGGQVATGANAIASLAAVGDQVLTVAATDSAGGVGSASINITIVSATAPTVTIISPTAGTTVNRNEAIQFQCTATTPAGAAIPDANITWQSALSGALPSGSSMTASLTTAGADTITCTATDPATNGTANATVAITVNAQQAPTVQITDPGTAEIYVKPGDTGQFDPAVVFNATARDFNVGGGGGNLTSAITWTLNPGGTALGTGGTAAHTFTTLGVFTVTASATDSLGATATDVVTVHVVNNVPPLCDITRPNQDGATLPLNAAYTLQGECFDPETNTTLAPTWTTSAQTAALGTGFTLVATLTVSGQQTLFACATDPTDATLRGCFSRPIRVINNTAPTACAISAPAANAVVNQGATVTLTGSANDAEDPQSTLDYRWTSSLDGTVGTGANTTTAELVTAGAHTLTLTVTDPGGLSCSTTVNVTVNAGPTLSITQLQQGVTNCLNTSCTEAIDVAATGTATDPQGVSSTVWTDSFAGNFGMALNATLAAPVAGKHLIVLTGTDSLGAVNAVSRSLTILPVGRTTLASALTSTGAVEDLEFGAPGALLWVDGTSSLLRRTNDPAGTSGVSTNLPDPGLAVAYQALATPVTFVGTDGSGVIRCESGGGCSAFAGGPLQPSGNVVTAVAFHTASDLLAAGTDDGLVIMKASDPANGGINPIAVGQRLLVGAQVRQVVVSPVSNASSVKLYAATDRGVATVTVTVGSPFNPATAVTTESFRTDVPDADVLSIAVSPEDKVYAGTRAGFAEVGGTGPSLRAPPYNFPDDRVQALVFERRTISGASRDVLWAGTRNGLVRYDLAVRVPSLLTTTDGLPNNDIRSLRLGATGIKYVGTAAGIGRYDGP